jgi:hypothetical protein
MTALPKTQKPTYIADDISPFLCKVMVVDVKMIL